MQIIPDSAAHETRSNPAIGKTEFLHKRKHMHALAICCNDGLQLNQQLPVHFSVHLSISMTEDRAAAGLRIRKPASDMRPAGQFGGAVSQRPLAGLMVISTRPSRRQD